MQDGTVTVVLYPVVTVGCGSAVSTAVGAHFLQFKCPVGAAHTKVPSSVIFFSQANKTHQNVPKRPPSVPFKFHSTSMSPDEICRSVRTHKSPGNEETSPTIFSNICVKSTYVHDDTQGAPAG